MIPNWNKILKEWSYRVGVVKPNNSEHLYHLNNILNEDNVGNMRLLMSIIII